MATYTDITLLIDRSGSMASIKEKMESGLAEFITQHQKVASTRLSAVAFDSHGGKLDMTYPISNVKIGDVKGVTIDPRGGTPLIDAICRTIDSTGNRFSNMTPTDRPDQVIFVIITDGEENASREFKRSDVKARIDRQQGTYNWQFVFMGANQDAIKEAATYGIAFQNALNYSGVEAYSALQLLADKTTKYASRASASVGNFTDDERNTAMNGPAKKP